MPRCWKLGELKEFRDFSFPLLRAFMPSQNKPSLMSLLYVSKMHFQRIRNRATVGKNFMPNNYAATTGRTMAWKHGSFVFTTFTVHSAHTKVVAKRLPQRCAERWHWRSTKARLKSGVTESRRARSCMWKTVSRVFYASWH